MRDYIDREDFIKDKRAWYCSDCVHRKGMKNGRLQVLYEVGDAPCRACSIDDMISDLEAYPAADVREVVHGRWVWNDDNGFYYCENCGATSPRENQDGEYIDCTNYCPNCGGKMDLEAEA